MLRWKIIAVARQPSAKELSADKDEIRQLVAEQYAAIAIPDDPVAMSQKARAMMLALGIGPEENEFSQGIIQAWEA